MTQYSRIPIVASKHLDGDEYKLLDYLLHRHALDGWKVWTSDLMTQTGIPKRTLIRLLKDFRTRNFLIQDKCRHYHLNYPAVEEWIIWCQTGTKIRCQTGTKSGAKMAPIQEGERKEGVQEQELLSTNSGKMPSLPKPNLPSTDEVTRRIQEFAGYLPSTRG
jgi:hypothetical protein